MVILSYTIFNSIIELRHIMFSTKDTVAYSRHRNLDSREALSHLFKFLFCILIEVSYGNEGSFNYLVNMIKPL